MLWEQKVFSIRSYPILPLKPFFLMFPRQVFSTSSCKWSFTSRNDAHITSLTLPFLKAALLMQMKVQRFLMFSFLLIQMWWFPICQEYKRLHLHFPPPIRTTWICHTTLIPGQNAAVWIYSVAMTVRKCCSPETTMIRLAKWQHRSLAQPNGAMKKEKITKFRQKLKAHTGTCCYSEHPCFFPTS